MVAIGLLHIFFRYHFFDGVLYGRRRDAPHAAVERAAEEETETEDTVCAGQVFVRRDPAYRAFMQVQV